MADPIDSTYIGKIVTFNVFAAAAIGGNIKNGRVEAIVKWNMVAAITGEDPAQMHAIVTPEITGGGPASHKDYYYAIIRTTSGTSRAVGMPWIDGAVTIDHQVNFIVTIRNRDLSEEVKLRQLLIAGGFHDLEITTEQL